MFLTAIQRSIAEYKAKKEEKLGKETTSDPEDEEENIYAVQSDDEDDNKKDTGDGAQRYTAHVPVPSQQDVEAALLRRRKQELMEKYGITPMET